MLDPEVAAEFLVGRTGDADRRAALELAGELGGLPLALEQAAAYIQASGDSLAGYLALFRQRRADLLARGEPAGYTGTVATTWGLAFDPGARNRAGRGGTVAAAGVLRARGDPAAAAAATPARAGRAARPPRWRRCWRRCWRTSWRPGTRSRRCAGIRWSARPADGSVSVHRLVQAVTADQMPEDLARGWRQAAAALIEAAIPGDPRQPGTWPVCAALLPHAQAALPADSAGMVRSERGSYLGSCRAADYAGQPGTCSRLIATTARDAAGPRNTASLRPPSTRTP